MLSKTNHLEWFIAPNIIYTIKRSPNIFHHSCYSTKGLTKKLWLTENKHYPTLHSCNLVKHTYTCLNALHLMSCLLSHRSLEGAMVGITSHAELTEQHPTHFVHCFSSWSHPELSFSWDCELPAHLALHICSVSCFLGRADFPSLISQAIGFDGSGKLKKISCIKN